VVDEFVDHYPDRCRGCGHEFGDDEKLPSRRPGRRQVAELPPITVVITEHRSHRLRCPCCKRKTAAGFPAAVAGSSFGPRLQAAVLTLTARNRISRRDLSELARDLFGIRLSVGAVEAICRRGAIALAEPHEALVASVLRSAAVNVDETGWVTAGNDRTLWTATTPEAAILPDRGGSSPRPAPRTPRRRVRRHLLLRPLVGLQPDRPRKPPSVLEPAASLRTNTSPCRSPSKSRPKSRRLPASRTRPTGLSR
jgi:hypothetical protein